MYLKKVEIQGFKSFGDLVKLDIQPGITAVVGPNGCGKSNIADAMRWVLGEQSAKTLRGERMQDIIFAGTQNRKGVGYAQVSMTIDNSLGKLPIDYSEVVVTRRVYRSGESEYLINKSLCRLKDIHEMFMGTGVGKEGYSIIGQGQIDKILSSKPEDRRNLFEEAAGVYKYKLRKLEAEKKLAQKKENLTRIQDILLEIEDRLETLEEQAEKAKTYMNIRENLKEIEVNIFIHEADALEAKLEELTKTYNLLQADYAQNQVQVKQTKELYEQIRLKLSDLQEKSTAIQNDIMNSRMGIEKHQSNIKVHSEKIKSTNEGIKRLKEDKDKRKLKLKEQQNEKKQFESTQLEIQNKIKKEEVFLSVLENDYEMLSNKVAQEEDKIEDHKNKIYQNKSKVDRMETMIASGDSFSEQSKIRKAQLDELLGNIATQVQHKKARYDVLTKRQLESSSHYQNILKDIESLGYNLEKIKQEQLENHKLHRNTEDLYHNTYSRHNALSQMKNDYEGFYNSVKNILNLKRKDPNRWQDIEGVVGELITVPKEFEIAIDVALGGSIQHIVTKDEQIAKTIIDYIKKYNLGRATFLPLSSVKSYPMGTDKTSIPNEIGVIGFANNLINFDKKYEGIMGNLLGRVIIVDHMNHAINLAKKYKYRYRIVTLDGEILNPGGSITGGNFHKNKGNIFSRDREVKELKNHIHHYKQELTNILEKETTLQSKNENVLQQLEAKQLVKVELEKEHMELKMESNHVQSQLKQYNNEILMANEEKEELSQRTQKMYEDLHSQEALIDQVKSEIQVMETEMSTMQEDIQKLKNKRELMVTQITDFKVSLSSNKEILKSTQEQAKRLEWDMGEGNKEEDSHNRQIEEYHISKEELLNEIEAFKEEIAKETKELDGYNTQLETINIQIKEHTTKESETRQEQDRAVEKAGLLQDESYRIEGNITKINLEKENVFSKIWDKYEITYQSAVNYKKNFASIGELKKEAAEYATIIRGLGVINTGAIEEFDEVKERYTFMKEHEQDILEAEVTLLKLIDNLTESIKKIFKEEFQKISDNFNIVFTELFGGGRAFLELTDTEDVLESGIEIIAQPPGKKLQNMMLLSGGERALTAIAILFGILRLKPSPFAILDEIEAALDDANVVRFSDYLKNMGNDMQFLVITHRKGTMAVADTIYGVTMEEQGVSKVISVQLDEAKGE